MIINKVWSYFDIFFFFSIENLSPLYIIVNVAKFLKRLNESVKRSKFPFLLLNLYYKSKFKL